VRFSAFITRTVKLEIWECGNLKICSKDCNDVKETYVLVLSDREGSRPIKILPTISDDKFGMTLTAAREDSIKKASVYVQVLAGTVGAILCTVVS